jgi:hypothetical protein
MTDDLHAHIENRDASYARHFSPLATLVLVWDRISSADRVRFLTETLTPAERQQLLVFGWDTDPEDAAPFAFPYALRQRVRLAGTEWCGAVVQHRYTERDVLGPLVEYLVQADTGESMWCSEPDLMEEPTP